MIRTAIYCRVSTEFQETSITNQQEYFKDYVERNKDKGYVISEIYTDEAISGGSTKNREDFKRMIKDGENKKYDCLLAKSYSRFGRNLRETLDVISKLREHGVRIVFIEDNLDSDRDYNNFALFGWLAESEIRRTSERIKLTWEHYNNRGVIHATHPPYGYDYSKELKNYVVNEKEKPIVEEIFDMYVNKGYGSMKITNILKDRGVPTKKGGKWANPTILSILKNRAYTGTLVQGKKTQIDVVIKKNKVIPKDQWKVHENRFERIISDEMYYKAQRILEKNNTTKNRTSTSSLFSNIIKCPYCGSSFTIKRQKHFKNYKPYYVCINYDLNGKDRSGHSRVAMWEEDLIDITKSYFLMMAENDFKILKDIIEAQDKGKPKEKNYKKELKGVERKIKDLTDLSIQSLKLLNSGIIGVEQYKLQSQQFELELKELNKEKEEYIIRINEQKHKTDDDKELINSVDKLIHTDKWDNAMLKDAIDYINIYKDKSINIQLKFNRF